MNKKIYFKVEFSNNDEYENFLRDKDISVTKIPEIIHGVCYVYHQEA